MDKVTTITDFDQAYIKKTNGDQEMQDMSPAAIANTLALRTTNARLKIGDAVDDNDAVTLRQLKNNLKPFKVKDVTLDGTSIVNTETGVVALESTYSTTLIGTRGTLTQEEYNNLDGDNASYIWYKTSDTDTAPIRLTKTYKTTTSLSYQVVSNGTLIIATLFNTNYSWSVSTHPIEVATNKVNTIDGSSTHAQYPSALAVYNYVTTELGKIDQFEYKVSTDAATTPEGIVWYSGATESTKITGTLKASATTEYTIYLVPCKHTAAEAQQGYDEYLTIKNSADKYVWEVLGNTRDLDLSDYVSKTETEPQAIKSSLQLGSDTQNCAFISETGSYKLLKEGVITEYNADNIKHGSSILTLPSKSGTIAVTDDITNALKDYVTIGTSQTIKASKVFEGIVAFDAQIRLNGEVGTAGQVLTAQGDGKAPRWTTIPQGTVRKYVKDITVAAGGTNAPSVTIKHDLNVTGCTVSLYQNNELVMADIQIVDKNNIKIIFGQTFATEQTFQVVVTG